MVSSRRTSIQLKMILSLFKKNEINGSYYLMNKLLENYFNWKRKPSYVNKNPNGPKDKNKGLNSQKNTSKFQERISLSLSLYIYIYLVMNGKKIIIEEFIKKKNDYFII